MVRSVFFMLLAFLAVSASAQSTPAGVGTVTVISPGTYDGDFTNLESQRTWGARLIVDKTDGNKVFGSITLYIGVCDSVPRPFEGRFEDGKLVGKTNGPKQCITGSTTDIAVTMSLNGTALVGYFEGNRRFGARLGGVSVQTVAEK